MRAQAQPLPPGAAAQPAPLRAPGVVKLLLECRAPGEFAALLAAQPLFSRLPQGDGHSVLVLPGLSAGDLSTAALRRFLRQRGYNPLPWGLGLNLGPKRGVLEALRQTIRDAARDGPISLVGWSLGGVYARELAKEMPQLIRCVITLGSPFAGSPRATNAWRLYEWVSGQRTDPDDMAQQARLRQAPAMPTTSIFSRSDGIVAWPCSLNAAAAHTENIEVPSSHIGMGLNPMALYAVADRLAQKPEDWKRFEVVGMRRWFFRTAEADAS